MAKTVTPEEIVSRLTTRIYERLKYREPIKTQKQLNSQMKNTIRSTLSLCVDAGLIQKHMANAEFIPKWRKI